MDLNSQPSTELQGDHLSARVPRPQRGKGASPEPDLQTLGRTHSTGGVGGFLELPHTPVNLSSADRPSPGPRGHGDLPPAGLPVVGAALLPLSRLRSEQRLLLSPVSLGQPGRGPRVARGATPWPPRRLRRGRAGGRRRGRLGWNACGAGSVAYYLEQRRRTLRQLPPVPAMLPADPGVRDLHVPAHALETHNTLIPAVPTPDVG